MHSCAAAPLALARTISSTPALSSILAPANSASSRSRPSLARQKKRVSFDAQTPLSISFSPVFQEPPASQAATSSPTPQLPTIERRRSFKDVTDDVDLKAVLAAGILEWRTQSATLGLESS